MQVAIAASFLAGMRSETVSWLVQQGHIREVPAGRMIVEPNHDRRCGLLISGLARVYAVRPDDSQVTLRRVGPGAAVGVHAIARRRNLLYVQAVTDVEFLELDGDVLARLGLQDARLAMAIADEIDGRLEDTELEIASLGGTVIQRIARFLLDLSVEGRPLEVSISQEQLAPLVGASRERVGHELRALAAAGLIELLRGRVVLTDPMGLQEVARNLARRGQRAFPAPLS